MLIWQPKNNDENLCYNKRKDEMIAASFYSCHLDCCVIWYLSWQQKKRELVSRPTLTTLPSMYQCAPMFHLCLCSPDVNFSPDKVSVPLVRVYKGTGVSDMQGRNLWQASPQTNGRGSEDEQDRRWKGQRGSTHISMSSYQSPNNIAVNEKYHCYTVCEYVYKCRVFLQEASV